MHILSTEEKLLFSIGRIGLRVVLHDDAQCVQAVLENFDAMGTDRFLDWKNVHPSLVRKLGHNFVLVYAIYRWQMPIIVIVLACT